MTAEIICVGTELLLGDIVNTNAQFLSRELAELGINVLHQHVIGDNVARLRELVQQARARSELLIFSGGLGPTEDDLTKETVAEAFGDTLVFDEVEWQKIVDFFAGTHRVPPQQPQAGHGAGARAQAAQRPRHRARRVVRGRKRSLRRPDARRPA